MLSNQPVVQWSETLNLADMPHDFFKVFGSIVCTIITLIFPYSVSKYIIHKLSQLSQKNRHFFLNEYMPELHDATKHLKIHLHEKIRILKKFTGAIMKILFSFAY